jgi:hypothetical protein
MSFGLIVAIGAQNAFVLRQGLRPGLCSLPSMAGVPCNAVGTATKPQERNIDQPSTLGLLQSLGAVSGGRSKSRLAVVTHPRQMRCPAHILERVRTRKPSCKHASNSLTCATSQCLSADSLRKAHCQAISARGCAFLPVSIASGALAVPSCARCAMPCRMAAIRNRL